MEVIMKSKFIIVIIVLMMIPHVGCKSIKKWFTEYRSGQSSHTTFDSTFIKRYDSIYRVNQVSVKSLEDILNQQKNAISEHQKSISYSTEQSTKPFVVKPKTYKFTANWVLDTSSIASGKLSYIAIDQPGLKATFTKDENNNLNATIEIKGDTLDIPFTSAKFNLTEANKTDSSQNSKSIKNAIEKDSINQVKAGSGSESGKVKSEAKYKSKEHRSEGGSKVTNYNFLWKLGISLAVCFGLYLAIRFKWFAILFSRVKKIFKNY